MLLLLVYSLGAHALLQQRCSSSGGEEEEGHARAQGKLLGGYDLGYALCLAGLELYCVALHARVAPALAFLPLLLRSLCCAGGLCFAWCGLGRHVSRPPHVKAL